jgi:hypothetical protein
MTKKSKNLIFFISHIDDFEFSCLGYLFKNYHFYKDIEIIIASFWDEKESTFQNNLHTIKTAIGRNISYKNLHFPQRSLTKSYDCMKDDFYNTIDFDQSFDIVTHDSTDAHSDHIAVNKAAFGLFKHSDRFVTIYSPSSVNFNPNYYVEMSEELYEFKHSLLINYDFSREQSYTKKGNYFRKKYTNIAGIYSMENFINRDMEYCEIYKIYKWVQ